MEPRGRCEAGPGGIARGRDVAHRAERGRESTNRKYINIIVSKER